ncbi:hypothetical protein BDZ45DRAFT_60443 [Acephala macrosclerotiorum]|nr:hypothetical protein BDZ45DRAFT_60443 [Acephala macrosclerotiorum]
MSSSQSNMNHSRPVCPSASQDSTMYDDDSRQEDYYRGPSSSQGYQNSRQDYSRSPPRGPAGEGPMYGERHYAEDRQHNYDRRRSRSPRREGRGRYTDRDREDYRSPSRDRSRSRSPYFGGPPNRNVILEGIPLEWTQEDVGHPISPSCGSSTHSNPLLP